jgi:hypothetical protein
MEALVIREVRKLLDDYESREGRYEGLIYLMFWLSDGAILPLYIGKTETLGRGSGNLSANVRSIEKNKGKFARWGDNYA